MSRRADPGTTASSSSGGAERTRARKPPRRGNLSRSGGNSVLECKNKKLPPREPSGRHARQEARARRASDYLSRGHVTDSEGRTTVSVDLDEPPSAYGVLRDCVDRAYAGPDGGSSVGVIGERDFILVLRHGSKTVGELMEPLMETVKPDGWRLPVLQGFSGAIWHPSPFRGNPYALPLSAAQRTDLAEGEMTVMRIVDAGALDYAGSRGSPACGSSRPRRPGPAHRQRPGSP